GLMGMPPLCGFVSKWRLGTAVLGTGLGIGWIGAAALIISALLTALYMMTIVFPVYFPGKEYRIANTGPVENKDPNAFMTGPFIVLGLMALALAVWAAPLLELIARIVV
ncbi:MAG: proton-conducting membrane transporter, partial [Oscillospiraceae bacterium]|nr:proton-conducting membrane transporter [Oscillospiraceae bacterium]